MVEAESNTATGLPVVSSSTLHQVKWHYNESWVPSSSQSNHYLDQVRRGPAESSDRVRNWKCRRGNLNPHALAGTSPSS